MREPLTAEDRSQITETLSLIGHIVDSGRLDRLEEAFAPDAVYDLTAVGVGEFRGVETIRQGARQLGARNPVAHHLTNVVITDEGDGAASVQSKGLLLMADGTLESVTHHDTMRRHDGGWRVTRHVITPQRAPMSAPMSAQ